MIYKKFIKDTVDKNGRLLDIEFCPPDNFNFAYDVVDVLGEQKPNKLAMLWVSEQDESIRFSFSDMMRESSRTANYFKSLGINKGDKVLIVLKRHYQFWFTMLALHKIGAVAIPATHLLTKKDLIYRFNAAEVKAIICTSDEDVSHSADEAESESPSLKIKCIVGEKREGWHDFNEEYKTFSDVFARPENEDAISKDDYMLMYFTSGTTGYPKIVVHDFTYALGHLLTAKYWQNVDPEGVHFTVSDTGWGKAVWGKLYGQWLSEAAVFTYDFNKFHGDDILRKIEKYKITTFCAPPTIYRFFIKEDLARFDLSSLKYATIAGEALNPEVFNKFKEITGISLMEGFGQTETTVTVANLYGMTPKPGSMGKPSPQYVMDVVDHEGNPVNTGAVGEIVLRTDKPTLARSAGHHPVAVHYDSQDEDPRPNTTRRAGWLRLLQRAPHRRSKQSARRMSCQPKCIALVPEMTPAHESIDTPSGFCGTQSYARSWNKCAASHHSVSVLTLTY